MELCYTLVGDYYLPNLKAPESPAIGGWGRLHRNYLRAHKRHIYDGLLLSGRLDNYLAETDAQAAELFDRLVLQMKNAEGVNEDLKANDQMAWVAAMNSIRSRAEEIVLHDLIYQN